MNPNDATTLQALGWVEAAGGDASLGIGHAVNAIRANPRDPWAYSAHVQLALAHFRNRAYAEALAWSERAAQQEGKLPAAHYLIALSHVGLGSIAKAKAALEVARRLAPEYIEGRLNGVSVFRWPEDRKRVTTFVRIAAGLEDPSAADAVR